MKIFEVKHGKYQKKKIGCDYCGEAKPVVGYKHAPQGQWQHVYLCIDCWPILKNEGR